MNFLPQYLPNGYIPPDRFSYMYGGGAVPFATIGPNVSSMPFRKSGHSKVFRYSLIILVFILAIISSIAFYMYHDEYRAKLDQIKINLAESLTKSSKLATVTTDNAQGGLVGSAINPTVTTTPINTVTIEPTSSTSLQPYVYVAPTPFTNTSRCSVLQGIRLPGAGYKGGSVDADSINPGFGSVVTNSDACFAACALDADCKQFVYDSSASTCYKMNKKFAYTSVDADSQYVSGTCV
jgi:hypothetical protein